MVTATTSEGLGGGSVSLRVKNRSNTEKKMDNDEVLLPSSDVNVDVVKEEEEAGNQSNDHYKSKLLPLRYKIRSLLLPIVRKETKILAKIQTSMRHPILDFYFAWTANLASHTFYVLMLPLPIWFGASILSRDLVYVLGLGIFFTGNFKDYMCLPRPRSPPLHRITMSSYTTQEYGFPLSHSANATAVTLVLFLNVARSDSFSNSTKNWLYALFTVYYVSLIFGRIYCGMHGFLDILVGSMIGVAVFLFRFLVGKSWDDWWLGANDSPTLFYVRPIIIIAGYILLIHFHSEPVDDCPCFDDSVAFIGVLIGLDISHWLLIGTEYLVNKNPYLDPILLPYDFPKLGIMMSLLRVILGIALVATWKALSKPVVFTILPPIYKFVGLYIPRRNFMVTAQSKKGNSDIRRQSISNVDSGEQIADINSFLKAVTEHKRTDAMGPDSDIDKYEMLAYQAESGEKDSIPIKISGVFKPRYDVEVIGRLIIYAGVASTAIWGFCIASQLLLMV